MAHLLREQRERFANECGEMKIQRAIELLPMPENANQPDRIVLENAVIFRGEIAAAKHKAIEALASPEPGRAQTFAERHLGALGIAADDQRESTLDQF